MPSNKKPNRKEWADLMTYLLMTDKDELDRLKKQCEQCNCERSKNPLEIEIQSLMDEAVGLNQKEKMATFIFKSAQNCSATIDNGTIYFCDIKIDLQRISEFDYLDALMCVDMFYTQNLPTQVRLWHEQTKENTSKFASKTGKIVLSDGKCALELDKHSGGWIAKNVLGPKDLNAAQKNSALSRFNAAYISSRFQDAFKATNSFEFGEL